MLKGLEIIEVNLSDVLMNKDFRLESEFHNANKTNFKSIKGEDSIVFKQYGTSNDLNEIKKGFLVLRLNEFDSFFISEPAKYCDSMDLQTYNSLRLKKDDVLICRTNGNPDFVGKSALVAKDYDYAFASYLFRVRPNRDVINSATLVTYLNCKYGRQEINKYSMVSNQANFSPAKFAEIRIPLFSNALNEVVENNVYRAFDLLEQSKQLYKQAEDLLLSSLGLQNWTPSNKNVSIKSFSDFVETGRLDAEYYQPKYDDIEQKITSYKGGWDYVANCCCLKTKLYLPTKGSDYKYVELSNIGNQGEINGCLVDKGENLPSRARRLVETNDVMVSYLEGSLKSVAIVPEEYNNSLCSTGFHLVKPKDLNAETLLVLFKSSIPHHFKLKLII